MNYLSLIVSIFGYFAFGRAGSSARDDPDSGQGTDDGNGNAKDHMRMDPAWCTGYSKYCSYSSIKTQCPRLCNVSVIVDPSWCAYYRSYCLDNPSIQAQCPHTCAMAVNGNWGSWGGWAVCSVTCGKGVQSRSRLCDHPSPSSSGKQCPMSGGYGMKETQTRPCSVDYCPIHGGYSDWSVYSKCSKSCGGGIQYRNRCCTNPFPKDGGNDCSQLGTPVEARVCNPMPCPIHGMYGEWSAFDRCTKSCGGGMQYKRRFCNNPPPRFGGRNCTMMGPFMMSQTCNVQPCPINGGYTDWTPFSKCSKSCGSGLQYRSRCCINPVPAHGGKPCLLTGEPVEIKVCEAAPCPIDGGWSDWLAWGMCTRSCGFEGVKMRRRSCESPKPLFNGKDCPGSGFETIPCNRVLCSVHGGFTQWSTWSDCSVSCGPGIRTSTRSCTNPSPSGGGRLCNGSTMMTTKCEAAPCAVDGNWGEWEQFGACSAPCGENGIRMRKRTCNSPPSMFGGRDCLGSPIESASCNRVACQRDGAFSEWTNWSGCSATCGASVMTRSRSCSNPAPTNGGKDCVGEKTNVQACNLKKCPEYKYGLDLTTWNDAEKVCANWGGHLASVTDQAEMDLIINGFSAAGVTLAADVYVWIGLTDMVITNQWRWIDGTPNNNFAPWGNGEPSHTDHHCVSMNLMSKTWWDRNCPTLYRYVCKK